MSLAIRDVASSFGKLSLAQRQVNNVVMITFWSQFSVYVLNTVLVLFLTRPILSQGLGYSELKAYYFKLGLSSLLIGVLFWVIAKLVITKVNSHGLLVS